MNRQQDIEPYWQDEDDWLGTVEVLPSNDPEGRVFAADIVGYLLGYAQLTNARALALVGDPEAAAYELLFSFSTPGDKDQFLDFVARMRTWVATTSKTISCRRPVKRLGNARPLVSILPEDVVSRAKMIASIFCAGSEGGRVGS